MRKHKFKVILLTLVALLMSTSLLTAKSKVTFENKAEEFIILPDDNDLFENFKNVMPGDTLVQEIILENSPNNDFTIKLYLKMETINPEDTDFLSKLKLRLTLEDQIIYEDTITNTTNLENYIHLTDLQPSERTNLIATLIVPIELNNDYQNDLANLNWTFMVEEIEQEDPIRGLEPDDVIPEEVVTPKPLKTVITGLQQDSYLYIIAIITTSLLVLSLLSKKRKKQ